MISTKLSHNPFFHRGSIKDHPYFFGRNQEIRRILYYLMNGQSVSVIGPRRIGKSSLLFRLTNPALKTQYNIGDKACFIYVDCQSLSGDLLKSDVYQKLVDEVVEATQAQPQPCFTQSKMNFLAFEKAIDALTADGRRIAFLFDEFEEIAGNRHLDRDFFTELRGLGQKNNVVYLTVSHRPLHDLVFQNENTLSSPFFNVFSPLWLSLMRPLEAEDLIKGLAAIGGFQDFSEDEINFIYQLAGFHPFFLQIVCYHLLEEKIDSSTPTLPNYDEVRRQFTREAKGHFDHAWRVLKEKEQQLLKQLARQQGNGVKSEVHEALEQNCLIYQGHIFSQAFAEFVKKQEVEVATPHNLETDAAPSGLNGDNAERAVTHLPPTADAHARPPLIIEGEILAGHRHIARQILEDEVLELARFQRLSGGYANFAVYLTRLRPPALRGDLLNRVLKFASAKDIKSEIKNYQNLVNDKLKIYLKGDIKQWFPSYIDDLPEAEWPHELAAMMYPYALTVGDKVLNLQELFTERLRQLDPKQPFPPDDPIQKILTWLFDALDDWQLKVEFKRTPPLTHEYDRLSRKLAIFEQCAIDLPELEIDAATKSYPTLFRQQSHVAWRGQRYRNPAHWIEKNFNRQPTPPWLEQVGLSYPIGLVHGDLNYRNILVEQHAGDLNNIWLIDFSDTHEGHPLRDFGNLEADLTFFLTPVDHRDFQTDAAEVPPLIAFEQTLLTPHRRRELDLEDVAMPDICREDRRLFAIWTYVRLIRQKARQDYIARTDLRPYYLSLLHGTLSIIYYTQLNEWQRLFAFLSAAMICEKLDQLSDGVRSGGSLE